MKKYGILILKIIYLQLFFTLVSLPVLFWWGLPFSVLSIVGNIIFIPFITIFLALMSIAFLLKIFSCSPLYVVYCIEIVCSLWLKILSWSNKTFLIYCIKPPLLLAITAPLCGIFVIFSKFGKRYLIGSFLLLSIIVIKIMILKLIVPKNSTFKIPYQKSIITGVTKNNKTYLVYESSNGKEETNLEYWYWIRLKLYPLMTQLCGSLTINALIPLQLNKHNIKMITSLATTLKITTIIVPLSKKNKRLIQEHKINENGLVVVMVPLFLIKKMLGWNTIIEEGKIS